VLCHRHPKVEEAVRAQLQHGDCFNAPTRLWVELAEHLVAITPFADWAAFAKNGSDVCTWAVEVAREHTGRRKVIKADGAYHGAHAWCTPAPAGVTSEDTANVATFTYNDLDSLRRAVEAQKGDVAAIIVSPFRHDAFHDQELPVEGFLPGVRRLCDEKGIVFILDDVRAGFRLHLGGSGERFGVQPDLACYAKALANGYPLAACVGRDALKDAAERVYSTVAEQAALILRAGHSVVVDAVYAGAADRRGIEQVAEAASVPFIGLWLDAPASLLIDRTARRRNDASDADADVVRMQRGHQIGDIRWSRLDASVAPACVLSSATDRVRERLHDVLNVVADEAR